METLEEFLAEIERKHGRAFQAEIDEMKSRPQSELVRAERIRAEHAADRKLTLEIINGGYKALAMKLNSDKGGSQDAMSRLSKMRNRLKRLLKP
jgi:hypothetical protein